MDIPARLKTLAQVTEGRPLTERAGAACRLAKELERAGEYEGAAQALSEFWPDRGSQPSVDRLPTQTAALILIRTGTLVGWLGSTRQRNGNQEFAKNLITKGLELFERSENHEGAAEAHADLALCYWREGAYDEARVHLHTALGLIGSEDDVLKGCILLRAAMVEAVDGRWQEALKLYDRAGEIVSRTSDDALKGSYHNQVALLYRNLGTTESGDQYKDRALIEYAAASFHFGQAGHVRHQACVDINLAFLFFTVGRYAEAHQYLDRARNKLIDLGDDVHLAQVNDTRARTLLAERRLSEAERFARSAVRTLEKGDEHALLAEALTTYGQILARSGRESSARLQLERAIRVAETAGDLEGAGRAKLTVVEELSTKLPIRDLVVTYRSAIDLLKRSQDPSTIKRLISCAELLVDTLGRPHDHTREYEPGSWDGFSFKKHIKQIERAIIERALRDASGSVTNAARLLGFKHHQSLISLLNTRHRDLLPARSSVRKRRKRITVRPKRARAKVRKQPVRPSPDYVSILHVEDQRAVARAVAEMLEAEDWRVDLCPDPDTALRKLTGDEHYDALIIDNDVPGLSGLQLVTRARKITHRRRVPIVVLSTADIEKEAWRAGADEFLQKPGGLDQIASSIKRLLAEPRDSRL